MSEVTDGKAKADVAAALYLAFELSNAAWKLGFTLGQQVAMQPKAISPCFVTTADRSVRRHTKALFRHLNLALQRFEVPRTNLAFAWLLGRSQREPQLPRRIATC